MCSSLPGTPDSGAILLAAMNDPRNDNELKQMNNGVYDGGATPYVAMDGDNNYNKQQSMEEIQKGQIEVPDDEVDGDPDYINFSWNKLWIFTGPGTSIYFIGGGNPAGPSVFQDG